jgi:hypothetical protein
MQMASLTFLEGRIITIMLKDNWGTKCDEKETADTFITDTDTADGIRIVQALLGRYGASFQGV